jgi:light-regulated signal transduction histidine kinase (bacteriophytochrome)
MARADDTPAAARANILLVDDQPANLTALEAILGDLGQNLVKAHSGEEALRLVLDQFFAVILLDVRMPGMDGYETARLIRSRDRCRHTPIVFLTAYESHELPAARAYALGAVDYLVKPLVPVILRAKVMGFVELFQKTDQVQRQAERLRQMERQDFERRLAEQALRQAEERYREVERLNAELERRVVERTAALEAANRELHREIAQRQRTAAELTRSNRELEQFAYVASHDLKEPLRKVRVFLQLLERRCRGRLDDQAEEFIAHAVASAARMQQLVNDLLAFARVGSRGKPFEPTDCRAILARAVANLDAAVRESGAEVSHGPLPTVPADARQLEQLFQNLLGNAIKFRGTRPPVVRVEARRQGDEWLFAVRDNGIGIEPQYAQRIFVIFERLHGAAEYPGTGIGLAICNKIVERHGGRIWVKSEPGRGATFYFTLPALKGALP